MKHSLFILFILIILFVGTETIHAARPRVPVWHTASSGITYSSGKLSRATNSVIITFLHMDRSKKIDYTLSYTANGIAEGVVGSITPSGQISDSRDLYFGTCSKGVCTPHYNIQGATLEVTTTLTSGAVNTKLYKIRI